MATSGQGTQQGPQLTARIIDFDSTFFRGVKSDCDPSQLPLGYAWSAENMINLGGAFSCRPGYKCIKLLPDGNLQGCAIFRPLVGIEQILVAISGQIYVSSFPFTDWTVLPNIQLSPNAKQVFWALTIQAAERLSTVFSAPIKVIPPKAVMFIQDGGFTAPAWYDGSANGHVRGDAFGTPSGSMIRWVGDRLWVADGNQVFASDIANPFSFREQIYLGGTTSFYFKDEVTAMVPTPSIESPQLMVFTSIDASILQANIRDRSTWPTTPNFQTEILQVGCFSNRSALSHYGHVVWFSAGGIAIFDPATSGKLTARLPIRDNEMLVSKSLLNEDLGLVAAASFGQYLLMSVPAEDVYNKHTWVLNNASLTTLSDDSGPCWSGYWTGTRPVEWVYGEIASEERIYYVSVDTDGKNRLWQAFRPERLDNGCPIAWKMETRGYFGQTAASPGKPPGERCRLAWVDVALAALSEDLDIGVYYAGGTRGAFRQIMNKKLAISQGSLSSELTLDINSPIFAFKPQSRVLRTEDANTQPDPNLDGSCPVERPDNDNIDESFQLAIVGHGPVTIRWIRPWAFSVPPDTDGDGTACQDETGLNAVRYDGSGAQAQTMEELVAMLAVAPEYHFESTESAQVSFEDFMAIAAGQAESVVSQRAANRVAEIIATKLAEAELAALVPPILSTGLGFE
jgi:hypothetical protein